MAKKIRRAICGSPDRPIKIGNIEIAAYVLEDGTPVLSGRGMQDALSLGQSHGGKLKDFLAQKAISPFIKNDLAMALAKPFKFIRPGRGGLPALGYDATILADICNAILDAKAGGELSPKQLIIAARCAILQRAFSKVGIVGLVYDVTGYNEISDRVKLNAWLDKFLLKEFAEWSKKISR